MFPGCVQTQQQGDSALGASGNWRSPFARHLRVRAGMAPKEIYQRLAGHYHHHRQRLGAASQTSSKFRGHRNTEKKPQLTSRTKFFSPTAESFGVSAQIGSGVVRGGPEGRFHEGSTRVPPGFYEGSTKFCEGCGVVRALKEHHAVGDIT